MEKEQLENLKRLILESIGEASMCWEYPEKAGIFKSIQAENIGLKLLNEIVAMIK